MFPNEEIHIALAFCDLQGTYTRHAAVTMASIFANAPNQKICVHIIHDDTLSSKNRDKLSELAQQYHQAISFFNITNNYASLDHKLRNLPHGGIRGTMYRVFIPEVLNVDKVIYLDCDVIVRMNIAELWNVSLDKKSVGAVRAFDHQKGQNASWRLSIILNLLGVPPDSYFYAGVMVYDLKKIREKYNYINKFADFWADHGNYIMFYDQDFLNWLFVDDVKFIDERFDHVILPMTQNEHTLNSIYHMIGGAMPWNNYKPWNSYTRPSVDNLYWKYLRMTPYCKNEDELLDLVLTCIGNSQFSHLHHSSCVSFLSKMLRYKLFHAKIWKMPLVLWKCFFRILRSCL